MSNIKIVFTIVALGLVGVMFAPQTRQLLAGAGDHYHPQSQKAPSPYQCPKDARYVEGSCSEEHLGEDEFYYDLEENYELAPDPTGKAALI